MAARRRSTPARFARALLLALFTACSSQRAGSSVPMTPATPTTPTSAMTVSAAGAQPAALQSDPSEASNAVAGSVLVPEPRASARVAAAQCSAADWTAHALAPLLKPGRVATPAHGDRASVRLQVFDSECTDSPTGPSEESPTTVVVDGVELRLVSATPAGSSRRGWAGNQCALDVRLADGSGQPVRLGAAEIPPFNSVNALVRSGSAVWLALSFNGYTKEFPQGGNRIIALDLCQGRVAWMSKDSRSNGGLLLLGDYLISAYGFTNEPRFVFVLDAHSGRSIQQLPVVENICPSKRWAPNWQPGEACDAPGQRVGAAVDPRVEGGLFLVDTNAGSSAFQLK